VVIEEKNQMRVFAVLPVHNRLPYTKKCLKAFAWQKYKDFEVIVVDDGSTDGTCEYIGKHYPKWKMIQGDGNWWWTKSVSKGVDEALKTAKKGDFILTMNNDCYFKSNYLIQAVRASIDNQRAIVGSLILDADRPTKVIDAGVKISWKNSLIYGVANKISNNVNFYKDRKVIKDIDTLPGKGTLIPIEVFKKIGNFNYRRLPHYIADYEFFCRAKRNGFKLIVSSKVRNYNFAKATGSSHIVGKKANYKDIFYLLFHRKSKLNIIDYVNFLLLCCPKEYLVKNLRDAFWRLISYLLMIFPFYYLPSVLYRFRLFWHNLPIYIKQNLVIAKTKLFLHNLPIYIKQNPVAMRIRSFTHNLPIIIRQSLNCSCLDFKVTIRRKNVANKVYSRLPIFLVVGYFFLLTLKYFNQSGFIIGDLGRELYAPIRVLMGQKLYLDFSWLYGPLPLWVNSWLYQVFSINLSVLYFLSLILGLIIAVFVYRLGKNFIPNWLSMLVAMIYIRISMFGFTWQSFILPGKFATLWATLFSLLLLNHTLSRYILNKKTNWFWVGILIGLLVITKIDYALASCVVGVVILLTTASSKKTTITTTLLSRLRWFLLGMCLIVVPTIGYLVWVIQIPVAVIFENIFPTYAANFWWVNRQFYNFEIISRILIFELMAIALTVLLITKTLFGKRLSWIIKIGLALVVMGWIWLQDLGEFKFGIFQPWYLISVLILISVLGNRLIPKTVKTGLSYLFLFTSTLALRDKLSVNSFNSFLPLIIIVAGLVAHFNHSNFRIFRLDRRLGFLATGLVLLLMLVDQSKYLHRTQYVDKMIAFESTKGSLVLEPSPGGVIINAVEYIIQNKSATDTVVSFPMETIIPFLTQTINPLSSDQFVNGLFSPDKEREMIKQLDKYRPSFITISNYEFLGYFGIDYYQSTSNWIGENYHEKIRYGCIHPYETDVDCGGYGIRILIQNEN